VSIVHLHRVGAGHSRDRCRGSSAHQFFLQRGATPAHAIEHAPFLHTEMLMNGRALNLKNLVLKFTER
jgi:hypothetical protein